MAAEKWLRLALGTALLLAVVSSIGLFNTWRWYQSLPWEIMAGPLPMSFWVSPATSLLQLVGSLIVLFGAAWGRASTGRKRVCIGLALLIAVSLGSWAHRIFVSGDELPLAAHVLRAAITGWLGLLLFRLSANNSLKRTDQSLRD